MSARHERNLAYALRTNRQSPRSLRVSSLTATLGRAHSAANGRPKRVGRRMREPDPEMEADVKTEK
jgi:hypothetical protein